MTSELQRQKYMRRFATLDVNGSGFLELADYVTVAVNMCVASGVAADSTLGASLVNAYRQAFERLAGNSGSIEDARVDLQTFVDFMGSALAGRPDVFDLGIKPIADLIVDVCDIDRDHHLDESDFFRFLGSYAVSESEAMAAARRLGIGPTDLISREEFVDHSRNFYCGDDPSDPGNWLFGDISVLIEG
ncbi:EF-hand domain-containing protein [Streptomyces sp. NPDC056069]|uniref:EF-hand domain-containing protein n=1 Tax=Streptomyces sp. NPDC056069 TaxID=3345702 RepID=UPI0035D55F1B